MGNPGQTITRKDGGLGLSGTIADRFLYVGVASSVLVAANALVTFYDSGTLRSQLVGGPVVEAAAWELDTTKRPVDVLLTGGTVAAANSAVTHSGTGPTVTIAGTAVNAFDATLTIRKGGILGAARFRYTLDGGESYSEDLTVPAGGTFLIPGTGITVTFPSGTYVADETYAFTTTPATYNSSDLTAAWETVLASHTSWPVVVFTGHSASASAGATLGAAIAGLLGQLVNQFRYCRGIVSVGKDTEANVLTSWATVESPLIAAFHGQVRIANGAAVGAKAPRVPYIYEAARRAAAVGLSTNPAWVGLPDREALGKVYDPSYDADKAGSALYDAKINAPRTFPGRWNAGHPEVLPTGFLLKSPPSSDYRHWQWGRVIDVFSDTVQLTQQNWVNGNLEVMTDGSGRIEAAAAKGLEAVVLAKLEERLVKPIRDDGRPGHISGAPVYQVDRTNNILTTGLLRSSGKAVPLANVEQLAAELGFATEV